MMVVKSNIIPFKGFVAINLFGLIFVRKNMWDVRTERQQLRILNHERIHTAQMKELLYVGFYIIYLFEWIYWLIFRWKKAYKHINFEKEAYRHQSDLFYLWDRKRFAQWRKTE